MELHTSRNPRSANDEGMPDFRIKTHSRVSGVAQWLACRSSAGGLSLPCADLWLTGDHFVGKLSAAVSQLGQLSLQSHRGR